MCKTSPSVGADAAVGDVEISIVFERHPSGEEEAVDRDRSRSVRIDLDRGALGTLGQKAVVGDLEHIEVPVVIAGDVDDSMFWAKRSFFPNHRGLSHFGVLGHAHPAVLLDGLLEEAPGAFIVPLLTSIQKHACPQSP